MSIIFGNKVRLLGAMAALAAQLLAGSAFAQQKNPFDLPGTIPTPDWVKQTDWNKPNVYAIDSLISVYKATHKAEERREKTTPDQPGEREQWNEDPYIGAYIRWRNKMAPFIQPDGSVAYDDQYNKIQLKKSLEQQGKKKAQSGLQRTTAAANWTVLGPTQTYSAGSANLRNYQVNVYCMAIAPSNPSVLYAATEPGSFFRSADKGLTWTSVSDTLYSCGSKSIAVDPFNENIVYTYDGSANVLLKTTTGGAGWSILGSYTYGGGNAIAINRNSGRILVTGGTSIYYSDNAGATWTMAPGSTVTGTLYDLVLNPTGTDTVYAVGSLTGSLITLLRSTDGGTTFSTVTGAMTGENTSGARLGVSPANTNYVYCVNIGSTSPPKIMRSTDRAATWAVTVASTTTGLTGSSSTTGLGMSNGQGYYDLAIMVSPANANHVIVGTTTTYKSTDGGFNFGPLGGYSGSFGLHPDLQGATALGGDAYLATDGGVNYSTDFFTNTPNWSVRNNGLRSADYWGFGQGWDEDIVVGGRYHNGNAAISEGYGGGKALSLGGGEDATGHIYHGQSRTAGFRDIGSLVLPATMSSPVQYGAPNVPNTMWPQDNYYGQFSSELVIDPRYSNTFYLGKDSLLWKSGNSGASYAALHNFGNNNKVWRFEICRSNPKVIYVCATNGLYKTTDAGATWTQLTLPVAWTYYNTDVAVNPLRENEVYYCMANAAAGNKVFRSMDGGATWTNITGATLNGKRIAFLQFHGGTNSGIYAISNTRPSKVYYRDSAMADWTDFSTGLPTGLEARVGALIFYRDSKIRLGGNCSIWESPLYTVGAPVAQPMADKKYVGCARDTVKFFDYSMNDYAGATRTWSFPGAAWVSSTTAATPKVVYPGPGSYSVSLTVTNALAQTHTRTIDSMIVVADDHCAPDTVAGKCIQLNRTNQTVNLGVANINSNNFSISCWIQPKGLQSSFSQIVSHDVYPGGGGYGFGFGFKFNGYTPNLILCYTDSTVNYANSSSLVCDSTQWNFVVLTYSPTGVTMYLNGVGEQVNSLSPMPVIDLSQSPFVLNLDNHQGQGSKYDGKIDEVKFYNYALSQTEVREKMHLITDPFTETGLIKYYQFNQYDLQSGNVYDVRDNFSTPVPAANIVTSTAPVSTGRVYRNTAVSAAGLNSFPAADVNAYLPTGGTYPDGEVVAFHLLSNPDTRPDYRPNVKGYFIVNNYGNNATFTQPDSISLGRLNISSSVYRPGSFRLFRRNTGDFGNTWSPELDSAARFSYLPSNSKLTFTANNRITRFNSQYIIVNNDTTTHSVINSVNEPLAERWSVSDLYPNPAKEWFRVNLHMPGTQPATVSFTITDIAGVTVTTLAQQLTGKDNTIMIPLPELAPGIYLVTIAPPTGPAEVRKLIID